MSNSHNGERSHSDDYAKYTDQRIQDVQLRSAEIGKGTIIKRALPSRHKRLVLRTNNHACVIVFAHH